MSIFTQYSRISHHTITNGATFCVPQSEDFTNGSWTSNDLALSEIGVDELGRRIYVRLGDTIHEFALSSSIGEGLTFSNGILSLDIDNGCCEAIMNNLGIIEGDVHTVNNNIITLGSDIQDLQQDSELCCTTINEKLDAMNEKLIPTVIIKEKIVKVTEYIVVRTTRYISLPCGVTPPPSYTESFNVGTRNPNLDEHNDWIWSPKDKAYIKYRRGRKYYKLRMPDSGRIPPYDRIYNQEEWDKIHGYKPATSYSSPYKKPIVNKLPVASGSLYQITEIDGWRKLSNNKYLRISNNKIHNHNFWINNKRIDVK